jgi:hypothetical protein
VIFIKGGALATSQRSPVNRVAKPVDAVDDRFLRHPPYVEADGLVRGVTGAPGSYGLLADNSASTLASARWSSASGSWPRTPFGGHRSGSLSSD